MRFPNPFKPWFVYRPGHLLRRIMRVLRSVREPVQVVSLPWGCPIEIDTRESIGRGIWTAGVHDLAMVEVLTRLADREKLAIDAGANIGAMTGALARRAAEVWAFEPHPEIHHRLEANLARLRRLPGFAPVQLFADALSDTDGEARLELPTGFAENQGLARLGTTGVSVRTRRLDTLLAGRAVGIMKVDVEGHELSVFHGAAETLAEGRVEHIVFEEHTGPHSPACRYLMGFGYSLFRIDWRLSGLVLTEPESGKARPNEAPNYIATRSANLVLARCRLRGWESLRSPRRSRA